RRSLFPQVPDLEAQVGVDGGTELALALAVTHEAHRPDHGVVERLAFLFEVQEGQRVVLDGPAVEEEHATADRANDVDVPLHERTGDLLAADADPHARPAGPIALAECLVLALLFVGLESSAVPARAGVRGPPVGLGAD